LVGWLASLLAQEGRAVKFEKIGRTEKRLYV